MSRSSNDADRLTRPDMQVDRGKGHPLSGLGIFEADLIEIHRTVLYVINGVFRVMKSALGQHLRDSFSRLLAIVIMTNTMETIIRLLRIWKL